MTQSEIGFRPHQRAALVSDLQTYFAEELDRELGRFEAEFLLEFLAEKVGPHFYNQALRDAERQIRLRIESVIEAVELLERPVGG